MPRNRIGISGWTFPPWRGTFYPKGLTQKKELEFASRAFSSIEINGTFYSLQRPKTFESWYSETPADFQFAVKAPQFITHVLRLKEAEEPLYNFLASGLLCLKEKLGPILWQFPPFVTLKDDRFEKFLELLPHDTKAAAKLAKRHGPKVEGRSYCEAKEKHPLRHAFELRHPSFKDPGFLRLLEKHNIAFVTAHAGGDKAPYIVKPTADFTYLRLHGEGKKYKKGYSDSEITKLAKLITDWNKSGISTYTYFSNEAKLYSPASAQKLTRKLATTFPLKKAA